LKGLASSVLAGGDYHDGSVPANRLGFQIARALTMNAHYLLRRRRSDADLRQYVKAYDRDGAFMIENFLPDDVFAAVREECRAAHEAGVFKAEVVEDNSVVEESVPVSSRNRDRFPVTTEHLLENEWLRRLGSAMARRPHVSIKAVDVTYMYKSDDAPPPKRLVGTHYIHADVHYPSGKAWLFLHDIDEENGAFVYAKGSQRLRLGRLLYEYESSIRVAKARREEKPGTSVAYGLLRMPTEKQLRRMGIRETVMSGKANTLVVASVMGFHRRGEFQPGRRREQIQVKFGDRPKGRK
jgi:hypothetical protein